MRLRELLQPPVPPESQFPEREIAYAIVASEDPDMEKRSQFPEREIAYAIEQGGRAG